MMSAIAEVVQPALALLEEQDELVARAVVVAHADRALVPHQRLPETEAGFLGLRLGDEHRFGVADTGRSACRRRSTRNASPNSSANRAFGNTVNQSLLDALLCFSRVVVPTARCFSSDS